jgi:iron-sulfur cluster assembly protein
MEHGLISVTREAAEQIARSAGQAGGGALRIAARLDAKGVIEYGMGFDDAAEGDTQVESGGVTLLVSPGSIELLTGATLDYVEINLGEWRFIFINPNDPSHKPPQPALI